MNYNYKFYEFLGARINDNNKKIQELLKDENVRNYLNLSSENRRLGLEINHGMEECSHVFIMTDVCEDGYVIYHCLKCGLTNEYVVKKQDKILTEYENIMLGIFERTFLHGAIIGDRVLELGVAREVYDFIKRENLSISHTELQKAFLHAYPKFEEMKNKGTLCKCNTKKSAAELWYEMEERCEDNAIATLNKIVENNEGKRK